ncbi:unnamed protein product [Ilex paraguariensis]|uniref:Uncharacterized protein n=1 Tax=Ilex paraguariensis TaxID=185542 RepID=A0ABC8U2Z7_9AQUA
MGDKSGIFRCADGIDKLLMLFGTLGSIGDGIMSPLTMLVLSGAINDYGGADLSISNHVVDKLYNNNNHEPLGAIETDIAIPPKIPTTNAGYFGVLSRSI